MAEKEEREESPYAYEVIEEGVVIYGYRGNENIVEIPEQIEGKPVVALEGDRESHQGFVGEEVKEVILPDTLKRIGSCAFEGTNVQIVTGKGGNFTPFRELSLEEIGEHGFKGCTQLMTIPSAKRIGEGAFEGCTSLSEIGLWGTERIEDRAFYGCILLYEVELGEDVEWIGREAF
ncbi:leucine-rich repeat domain-containing protein, partial [bacterium 1XD42-8]